MATKTQVQILKLLLGTPEERLSIRKIARLLGKSYALTYNNIQKLLKKGIVETEAVPPAQVVRLSENASSSVLVDIERLRTEDFLEKHSGIGLYLHDVLAAAPHPFFIMLVFGSYAKGTETKGSDVDILVIVPIKDDISVLEKVARQYTKTKKSIVVVDTLDFLEMIENPKGLNVGNEARKHHIILHGAEAYYQLLKKKGYG